MIIIEKKLSKIQKNQILCFYGDICFEKNYLLNKNEAEGAKYSCNQMKGDYDNG